MVVGSTPHSTALVGFHPFVKRLRWSILCCWCRRRLRLGSCYGLLCKQGLLHSDLWPLLIHSCSMIYILWEGKRRWGRKVEQMSRSGRKGRGIGVRERECGDRIMIRAKAHAVLWLPLWYFDPHQRVVAHSGADYTPPPVLFSHGNMVPLQHFYTPRSYLHMYLRTCTHVYRLARKLTDWALAAAKYCSCHE